MSRAFVKEEEGGAWEAPAEAKRYQVLFAGAGRGREQQVVFESDDLLQVLRWMTDERRPELELRENGLLLACV